MPPAASKLTLSRGCARGGRGGGRGSTWGGRGGGDREETASRRADRKEKTEFALLLDEAPRAKERSPPQQLTCVVAEM